MSHPSKSHAAFLSAVALLLTTGSVLAQTASDYSYHYPAVRHGVVAHRGYFFRPYAGTAFESRGRGIAFVIDAAGRFNLNTALGNVQNQEARRRQLENDKLGTKTYYEKKVVRQQYYLSQHEAKRQRQEKMREAAEVRQARNIEIYRLAENDFDHTAGTIVWPEALKDVRYADLRTKIEDHFRDFLQYETSSAVSRIEQDVARLQHELRQNRGEMEKTDHREAQKFLIGLVVEAKSPRA